jgi:hypothetical protein
MKTLGRILIILLAFALVMGITYTVVSAASGAISSNRTPAFERGDQGLPRSEGARPPFPGGEGRELRGAGGGLRWVLGFVKNIGIIAIIVWPVLWLKNFMRRRNRDAQPISE